MAEENKQKNNVKSDIKSDVVGSEASRRIGGFQKNRRLFKRGSRFERVKPEFDHRVLSARRVSRVTKGGKRFNLSLTVAVGNRKGKIGVGMGKGFDNALALDKAMRRAKKMAFTVNVTKTMSIPHPINAKYSSAEVMLMPAPNRGLIAGSAVRMILELGGLRDINAKIISGSKNKLNIAKATIKALKELKAPRVAQIKEVKNK